MAATNPHCCQAVVGQRALDELMPQLNLSSSLNSFPSSLGPSQETVQFSSVSDFLTACQSPLYGMNQLKEAH